MKLPSDANSEIVLDLQGVAEIIGMGGRLESEWVADFDRNRWPDCRVIRKFSRYSTLSW
jgi:hypothetical protein